MTTLQAIGERALAHRLAVFGAFHPKECDGAGSAKTLILVGPDEPGFWNHFTSSPEWQDGAPDPMDRWSKRVITALAAASGGRAIFPSDGPPYPPFFNWALRTGRSWRSPVKLLVHDRAGLMVSFRGALALGERIELPATAVSSPCESCADRPCLTACPVGALTVSGYDVAVCHTHLDRPGGRDCISCGCRVRRACPVSQAYGRLPEQSAYHMGQFHR
ncbi:MAG: ferredoxin [Rhodobacteraceae bacterium]|nr:ferredoxin [Paracoccaceae bacterium]